MVTGAAIYKMLVCIANREDPDQTASSQSDLGLHCLSRGLLAYNKGSKI